MTTKETEYKGHPVLEMSVDGRDKPVVMGLSKLRAVIANLDDVKAFLAKHQETAKADTTGKVRLF